MRTAACICGRTAIRICQRRRAANDLPISKRTAPSLSNLCLGERRRSPPSPLEANAADALRSLSKGTTTVLSCPSGSERRSSPIPLEANGGGGTDPLA
ncbi:hypothetical protein E2542_SST28308 [Spatholobus suberectus]|nr:hypothetical protein E2542_SST28308 [Spatholobus suberectus]